MTYAAPPLVKAYIWAAQQARTRAELAAWMETQKPRMRQHLPAADAEQAIEGARDHWRKLEIAR